MASFFDWQLDRSSDLLQNCDLPPPLKLFSPFDKDDKRSQPKITTAQWDDELAAAAAPNSSAVENTSLRRALQLSQSRAREAEKKAAAAKTDREQVGTLLLEESLRLSAHRQWVNLLEVEVATLKNKKRKKLDGDRDDGGRDDAALTWCLTLALCLGIGFALGRYMF